MKAWGEMHVVPMKTLAAVWVALIVLTVITVAVTYVDLGPFNLVAALAIATVKGSLVALYFMHLRWDRPFNALVFLGALAFVVLFIGLVLLDTTSYQPNLIPGYSPGIRP